MAKSAVGEKAGRSTRRSEFGKCLLTVMQSRDIFTARQLADVMSASGSDVADHNIRQHMRDRVTPRVDYMEDLDRALNLTPIEKARLSTAIFFGEAWREI